MLFARKAWYSTLSYPSNFFVQSEIQGMEPHGR
jgi:hypothetical protein